MRPSTYGLLFLAMVLTGLSVFGYLVYRSVDVERVDPESALREFETVRTAVGPGPPMLRTDETGRVVRDPAAVHPGRPTPSRLRALVHLRNENRLARADVPFWFFQLKGPAVQLALKPTGIDLEEIGVTPADLEVHGVGLVLDETRANGDRVMVWTE